MGQQDGESRDEARSLRELLSFTKKKEKDPLMEYLVAFRDRMGQARDTADRRKLTAFFFVTLPEALPIAVITRFIGWFHDFGIPVGGVVVNMLIDKEQVNASSPEFVQTPRRHAGSLHDEIWGNFDGNVRAIIPLLDDEVRGTAALTSVAKYVFV